MNDSHNPFAKPKRQKLSSGDGMASGCYIDPHGPYDGCAFEVLGVLPELPAHFLHHKCFQIINDEERIAVWRTNGGQYAIIQIADK